MNIRTQSEQDADVFEYLKQLRNTPIDELAGERQYEGQFDTLKQSKEFNLPELAARWQKGDTAASGELLKALKPTMESAITQYAGGNPEYRTKAKLIALEAVKTWQPGGGAALSSHVHNHLQRLKRLSADRGNFIHIPEKSALERNQLDRYIQEYTADNGVEPSMGELADLSGMSIKKIQRLQGITGATSESATTGESGDMLYAMPRTAMELYVDSIYSDLEPRDQKIYEWSTGYRGVKKLPPAVIASKLGISQSAVSQRLSKITRKFANDRANIEKLIYGGNQIY